MSDFDEAFWEDVECQAPDKFLLVELENHLFARFPVVLGSEDDLSVIRVDNAVVGDGDFVGIPSEVFHDSRSPRKRLFGIDDPIFGKQGLSQAGWDLDLFA